VVISDPDVKHAIREAAEAAEVEFYATAPAEWLAALAPLGTDAVKAYLETAPYLIAVFAERYGMGPDGGCAGARPGAEAVVGDRDVSVGNWRPRRLRGRKEGAGGIASGRRQRGRHAGLVEG